jgi:hypothetical protein
MNNAFRKIIFFYSLTLTLASLSSIFSSFATVSAQEDPLRPHTTITFSGIYENKKIQIVFPGGNGVSMTYNLGVDLGMEKVVM